MPSYNELGIVVYQRCYQHFVNNYCA